MYRRRNPDIDNSRVTLCACVYIAPVLFYCQGVNSMIYCLIMNYKDLLEEWRKRREEIKADYATGKYSIRDLAKKYDVTDSRILVILHDTKKSTQ